MTKKKKNRRVFVTSDPHLGDHSLYIYKEKYDCILRPEFSCAEEHDELWLENMNAIVNGYDTDLYILGDLGRNITAVEKYIPLLEADRKFLVMGNHDAKFVTQKLSMLFDKLMGVTILRDKEIKWVLSHVPIHPIELRECYNIHGHVHRNSIPDSRYVNACLEVNDYKPLELF